MLARALWVAAVIAVIALILWGMRRGWVARMRRQSGVSAPAPAPDELAAPLAGPITGRYLGSVNAGDWLDRIVVHGLGVRSSADLEVDESGILLRRRGAVSIFIRSTDVRAVRADRGIAGRVYERGGVLVITWDLDGRLVDSGFRADVGDEQVAMLETMTSVFIDERTP